MFEGLFLPWQQIYHLAFHSNFRTTPEVSSKLYSQTNKEAHLELFRVFLALCLVEFQCFGGHFENEYQVCFNV